MNFTPFTYFNSRTAPIMSYIGATFSLSGVSQYTFTNLNFDGGNGLYVLSVQAEAASANRTINSVIVGGVTASLAYQLTTPINTTSTIGGLFYLRQSASSNTVVINFSAAPSRCYVAVYRITNNLSDIPYQGRTASASSGTGLTISFTSLSTNSVIISSQTNGLDTAGPITWTNATSVYDLSLGTGTTRITGATSSVANGGNLTISTSHANSTQPILLVGASWS